MTGEAKRALAGAIAMIFGFLFVVAIVNRWGYWWIPILAVSLGGFVYNAVTWTKP